ncbi:MAG: metallophosphoesterase [Planctomycetaceae bacterium]|jgi:3',5'-cyclic-AMP phosphodiesterase|nr:metallophosphoesterase [Planctomycetaceae bacterium]
MNKNSRRTFLKSLATAATSIALPSSVYGKLSTISESIKLGIITDTHIGFVDDAEERFSVFMRDMDKFGPDALLQLGDFAHPIKKFQKIADTFNAGADVAIHAIGNHDLDFSHTREDCVKAWGMPNRYYTKTVNDLRIIVLDGNDKGSPTHSRHGGYASYIGPDQQKWLAEQLSGSDSAVLIVSHQPLAGRIEIDNAKEIQTIISRHKDKVILCLNGHSHVDQQIDVNGVTYLHCNSASYFWLGGMVRLAKYKDPLYATMTIDPKKKEIRIDGIRSSWLSGTPEDAKFFTGKNAGLEKIVVPEIRNRILRI